MLQVFSRMFVSSSRWDLGGVLVPSLVCAGALVLSGCGGGGGGSGAGGVSAGGRAQLVSVHFGRLADVYGFRSSGGSVTVELYQKDVMVGPDIQDERDSNSTRRDDEILYDFVTADPDTLQPRLLITRTIGSTEFQAAFDALDDRLRLVAPAEFGQDTQSTPFTVVPRNAAVRLLFGTSIGVDDTFFVERDASGKVTGVKNSEAIQLLKIVADPRAGNPRNAFQVIPARVVVRGREVILDPVLLGSEGLQYQTRNNAAGLPEAADQKAANIRVAIALEGPLRVPGVTGSNDPVLGFNAQGQKSIVRDFRSGNHADSSSDIAQGFVRDPIPPRLVGEILTYVESVDPVSAAVQRVRVYKNGVNHEIDRGDTLRFVDTAGRLVTVSEVVVDPDQDRGRPSVQHVDVLVRRAPGLQELDPRGQPGYPGTGNQKVLEDWLVKNAARSVVVCEFTAERRDENGQLYGDDPRYFITFSPSPLANPDGSPSQPNENISPFAGVIVRFTKPVDLATVRGLDTYFFGTRNLLDDAEVEAFRSARNIDPATFSRAKFTTPHLVFAKVFDEDGSQTAVRLQSPLGFYLDATIRQNPATYPYFVHLLGGGSGIKDLSGNPLDFQSVQTVRDYLAVPFTLDGRTNPGGSPWFADNHAVTVARRFADADEDPQPSYYRAAEIQQPGTALNILSYRLPDVFGSVVYLGDGSLGARPTARVRQVVDDLNQLPPPAQSSVFRWCPQTISGQAQIAANTATARFGAPIQNPLNPFGARLQTVWREIDMSLSRTDPFDFNLDLEQMFWAPFAGAPITYDQFDRLSLFVGHSEMRPEPCIGQVSALPSMTASGLGLMFADNFANDQTLAGAKDPGSPVPHTAFVDKALVIDASLAITEPNNVNRFLPLPKFQKPYFVWRDETQTVQGGSSGLGTDLGPLSSRAYAPYILSPFLAGQGRYVSANAQGQPAFNFGAWQSSKEFWLVQRSRADTFTGGQVGSIALPLLADFWVYPDSPDLPVGEGFLASGSNGWQIALPVQSAAQPNFRVLSAGGRVGGRPIQMTPSMPGWNRAEGGYTPTGARTSAGDNSVYWIMADFVKRSTVVTNGFVEILNPHRMPATGGVIDPRLGPYFGGTLPTDRLPVFGYEFEPSLDTLPGGTSVTVEFRGAGAVDTLSSGKPWRAAEDGYPIAPDTDNFPLDPFKAGDAHIRKFDDRALNGQTRNTWTGYYNRNMTSYVPDPNTLVDVQFTRRFAGPNESFQPQDVKYFNWRFLMKNNVDVVPPATPSIHSFAVTYRFERTR